MAYIGNIPAEKYVSLTTQHFTVTATASYVLTNSVANENGIALFINNVRQEPGGSYAYTAAGTTLTLSAATAGTDTMYCVYLGKAVGTIVPPDGSVNSAKIVDGSITNDDLAGSITSAKITSLDATKLTGTVDNARISLDAAEIPNLDTAKVTSGTFHVDRISEASVTQHVTAVDLTPVTKDISLLALQNAINGNLSAYGLTNSWIEQFENSTYIDNLSTASRNEALEYMGSGTSATTAWPHASSSTQTAAAFGSPSATSFASASVFASVAPDPGSGSRDYITYWTDPGTPHNTAYGCGFDVDYLASYTWSKIAVSNYVTNGTVTDFKIQYTNETSPSTWITADMTGASVSAVVGLTAGHTDDITGPFNESGVMSMGEPGAGGFAGGLISGFPTFTARHLRLAVGASVRMGSDGAGGINMFLPYTLTHTWTATGSFTSTVIVPQDAVNKSSVGLVMLYKDNAGTNTLNTDIIAKVRANTGQAYQTLVLAGAGTYSDSLKIAIAPAISVTAGQALSYEISFANQASSSKEARIYGVAMTY